MFLDAIDVLTPAHLKVLRYFSDPLEYFKEKGIEPPQMMAGSRFALLEAVMPELKSKPELVKLVGNDLSARGFLTGDSSSIMAMVTQNGLFEMLASTFGRRFLRYITLMRRYENQSLDELTPVVSSRLTIFATALRIPWQGEHCGNTL